MRAFVCSLLNRRFFRFLLVGGINTLFAYAVYAMFLLVGLGYAIANLLALIGGILFSFKTQGTLVFKIKANGRLFRFTLCWLLIYLCNIGLIRQMLILGLDAYWAGAVAIPPVALMSFFVQKYFVFNRKRDGITSVQ